MPDKIVNHFVLADGSTAKYDATQLAGDIPEVVDIRTGFDGTVYESAGDAVRGQVEDLHDEVDATAPIFSSYFDNVASESSNTLQWADGTYYDLTTGVLKNFSGLSHTEKIACKEGDILTVEPNLGQILFWGETEYISYLATTPSSNTVTTAPAHAKYYACNNRDTSHRATNVTKKTTSKVLKKTEYNAPAKAIYDNSYFVHKNYASTANGRLYTGDSYSTWYCAYAVKCKPNHRYRTCWFTQVVFYDASMAFLSSYVPTGYGSKVEMDFTTPSDAEYMSVNSNYSKDVIFDLEYIEYGDTKSIYNLIGKNVVCFGDSITGNYTFGDNYPYQIEEKTGAKTYNVGFGGCTMELTSATSISYINPFSMVSLADAIVSESDDKWSDQDANVSSFAGSFHKNRLDILKSIDFTDVDIITIAYGTNGLGSPLDDETDQYNKYTYAGATRYTIKTLLEKYPHLRIVLLTPIYRWYSATSDDSDTHQISGQTIQDRANKLVSVSGEIKTPCIDLYHTLGINKFNYGGYFGDDDEQADGTHINSFGREQMGLRIAGELDRLF